MEPVSTEPVSKVDVQVREVTVIWRNGEASIELSLGLGDIEACEMLADGAAQIAHRIANKILRPEIAGIDILNVAVNR